MSDTHDTQDVLAGLLLGDLDRATASRAIEHLHQCESCRRELVDVARAHGALTAAARVLRAVPAPAQEPSALVELPPLKPPVPGPTVRLRLVGAVAAALVLVLAGAGLTTAWITNRDQPRSIADSSRVIVLQAVQGNAAGRVAMSAPGDQTRMTISTTNLPPAGSGQFYYAWLLDPVTNKMLPLGVLTADGSTGFAVSEDLVKRYHAVDISLQDDDGNPAHSATSVLRARY